MATNIVVGEDTTEAICADGSRREGHRAAATTHEMWYLGELATVMDAEMLGIEMGCSKAKQVATDSQGAIGRIEALRDRKPRLWIEEFLVKAQSTEEKEVVWVKAHSGIPGDGYADYKVKKAALIGGLTPAPDMPA